ncbi:MAG: exosortase, PEP-CTERM interaction domain protein [Moorea sp. SIO3C2]|nr:exosortase, PEP-CTERM interaction domain protein [Moorena sp. SIO3C2]
MTSKLAIALIAISVFELSAQEVSAASITPINLDDLTLGATITGPVGPTVDASLINGDGNSLGDLTSSVSCPVGFLTCVPPQNPAGTIYTYIHKVTPGVDFPNDPPFPQPDGLLAFDDVNQFGLEFKAEGFTGVAGYSFGEAKQALGASGEFSIKLEEDGSLVWSVVGGSDWSTNSDTPETISFFWQTTQPPIGPFGTFTAKNDTQSGTGNGPLPLAVPVPEPMSSQGLLALGFLGLGLVVKRAIGSSFF